MRVAQDAQTSVVASLFGDRGLKDGNAIVVNDTTKTASVQIVDSEKTDKKDPNVAQDKRGLRTKVKAGLLGVDGTHN